MAPPTATAGRWRGRLSLLGKALMTALILAYLLHRIDFAAVAASLRAASWPWLGLGLAACLLNVALGGVRWWLVLRGLGEAGRPGPVIAVFWIGMAFSQILPSTAADGIRVWLATRRGWRLAPALTSVVLERLSMLLVLLALVVATEPLLVRRLEFSGSLWLPAVALAGGAAGSAVLLVADRLLAVLPRALHRLRAAGMLAHLAVAMRRLVRSRWAAPLAALTLATHLNLVLAGWLAALALGLPLSLLDNLLIIPLVVVATVLPISVSGWGLREGLLVALLARIGIAGPDALAFSLVLGLFTLLSGVPGLVLWLSKTAALPPTDTILGPDDRRPR